MPLLSVGYKIHTKNHSFSIPLQNLYPEDQNLHEEFMTVHLHFKIMTLKTVIRKEKLRSMPSLHQFKSVMETAMDFSQWIYPKIPHHLLCAPIDNFF